MTVSLKVLTYNIHKGFSPAKLRFHLPKMREALLAFDTDVVFLQEVQGEHKRQQKRVRAWPDETQLEFLAEQIWPHTAYGKNAIYDSGHHGNAILSKYPFIEWENINVSRVLRASRSLLHGIIQLPETSKPVHVICIHFGFFKSERELQMDRLHERIKAHIPEDEPLIIAGDFNDWRKAATDYLETKMGFQEVFKELHGEYAKTFPALKPTLQTDRIYFRNVALQSGQCLQTKPWRTLSDHLPLSAEFTVE